MEWLNEQLISKDKLLSAKDAQLSQLMCQLNDMALELSQEKMRSQQTLDRYETQIYKLSESNADLTTQNHGLEKELERSQASICRLLNEM
jgi:hypothetical protein